MTRTLAKLPLTVSFFLFHLLVTSLYAQVTGSTSWYDVTSAKFGAKCDGVMDDTPAFQSAIDLACQGGTVVVPVTWKKCVIASTLKADKCHNLKITSNQGSGEGNAQAVLLFTGKASPLISLKSSSGTTIENLDLQQSNSGFTGMFIDTEHSDNGADSSGLHFRNLWIGGTGGAAVNATCLICLDQTIDSEIEHVTFEYAVNAIRGLAGSGSYSNVISVHNNSLGAGQGTSIRGAEILNPGSSWIVYSNAFEIGTVSNVIDMSTLGFCNGSDTSYCANSFFGNWFGDPASNWHGNVFKQAYGGLTIQGNGFSLFNTNTGKLLDVAEKAEGITFNGNYVYNFGGTVLNFNSSNQNDVVVQGNSWHGVTGTFMSGIPSSGYIVDKSFHKHFYGPLSINGGTNSGVSDIFGGCMGTFPSNTTGFYMAPGATSCSSRKAAFWIMPSAGTIHNLRMSCSMGGSAAASGTVTLFKGGAPQSLTCTTGKGTSCSDTTHSYTVTAGDKLQVQVVTQSAETLANCMVSVEKY